MKGEKFIREEMKDSKKILRRLKNRDFHGDSGKVIKNSFWQIATLVTAKIGSLLFTILLARIMLPEIYGLYGLALSTILFFSIFNDFGITTGLGTFLARNLDDNPGKAKSYFYYFGRYKFFLLGFSSLLIILSAKFLAGIFYNKPILYALLVGVIYLPIQQLIGFVSPLFNLNNNFKPQFIKELILQISRITLIPLVIIFFLEKLNVENYLLWLFVSLSLCYFIGLVYLLVLAKKKHPFNKRKSPGLNKQEKKNAWIFILPLSVTALSAVFFGYIDQIMLGHYVESAFLGFYQAAFNLITAAAALISFIPGAVFPVLARLKGSRLEKLFKKSRNTTLLLSILAMLFTWIVSKWIILLIYGAEYLPARYYLIVLALLLVSFPMISIYQTYFMSQEKSAYLSITLLISAILNIFLNYFLINLGSSFSMYWSVMGAAVATVISRYFFMVCLIFRRRNG
jgi:O-antigen/teichoic acid export membrane protein